MNEIMSEKRFSIISESDEVFIAAFVPKSLHSHKKQEATCAILL